jgi:hypothetical protein
MTGTPLHAWRFAPRSPFDVDQEVTELDQFDNDQHGLDETLAREAEQNSLDAADQSGGPVRVRIAHVAADAIDRALLQEITAPLLPRLDASGLGQSTGDRPPSALVVEDFGTTGLTGDIHQPDSGFRAFWFNHGGSRKQGGKLGRHGLGKLVFPASSALRCSFGLTVRVGESDGVLLGQAVLRTHTHAGQKYAPHAHWGSPVASDSIEPLTDPVLLARFRRGFGLERGSEPGLSVIVPYPRWTPEKDRLLRYVIVNYAFPILTGRLVVDVMGEDVNHDSLPVLGAALLKPGLVDFIREVHVSEAAALVRAPKIGSAQEWRYDETSFTAETLSALRDRYAAGGLLGIRVPVEVTPKGETTPKNSHVDVFIKPATEDQDADALCVRGAITVPGETRWFRSDTHFMLLRAEHSEVAAFLGDAENPAHTEWNGHAVKFRERWHRGHAATLSLIRRCPRQLLSLLVTGRKARDDTALRNFFSLPEPGQAKTPGPKRGPGRDRKPKPDRPPPSPARLRIARGSGGFTVRAGPGLRPESLPAEVELKVAYDTDGGDPFKAWNAFDFKLDKGAEIDVELDGGAFSAKGNRVALRIDRPDFKLTAAGFDERRDLVVHAGKVKGVRDAA